MGERCYKEDKPILLDIRHAQWRWDFAAASHGGVYAPLETVELSTGLLKVADAG